MLGNTHAQVLLPMLPIFYMVRLIFAPPDLTCIEHVAHVAALGKRDTDHQRDARTNKLYLRQIRTKVECLSQSCFNHQVRVFKWLFAVCIRSVQRAI